MAPPFVSWASGFWLEIWVSLGEKRDGPWVKTFFFFCSSPKFGRKMGRNLSEDLFFLCSSPTFGRKMRLNLSGTTSDSDLCSSQIFWNFWLPPFQNPAYATDRTNVPYPYLYKKGVLYKRTILNLSKNWGAPYLRTVLPSLVITTLPIDARSLGLSWHIKY